MMDKLLTVVMVLALTGLQAGAAERSTLSGSVVSVDPAAGTLVLGDMGPWRASDPQKSITSVTVATDSQTTVVVVRRMKGPDPDGWIGGYTESPASLRDIKPGDFVSVKLRADGPRPLAARITRVEIGG